jgi:hypothetical protein
MCHLSVIRKHGYPCFSVFLNMMRNRYNEGTRLRYKDGSIKSYEFYYREIGRTCYLYYTKLVYGEEVREFDRCICQINIY